MKVLTVDWSTLNSAWGTQRFHLVRGDVLDNSDLTPAEDEDRKLRHTVQLTAEAWLPQSTAATEVPVVLSGDMEVLDNTDEASPVTLDGFTVT